VLEDPGLARASKLGEPTIRAALEELALQVHQRQGGEAERVDAPADIPFGEVLGVFAPRLPEDVNPKTLLDYLENQAGLLIGRREGVYAFPHRSFQEYLAVCHLANNEPDFAARLRDLVWQDLDWWREAFLLGVGKKRQGGLGDAVNVDQHADRRRDRTTSVESTSRHAIGRPPRWPARRCWNCDSIEPSRRATALPGRYQAG
jgi:hypothetical protein